MRSTGCPVTAAIRSKSLPQCNTVSPASSAVAAMIKSGTDGARCCPWSPRSKVGAALVDVGNPFGSSATVRDDGTEGVAGDLIGYTIVEADDLAAAKAFTDGLPFLSNRDGTCAVEIFELLPM